MKYVIKVGANYVLRTKTNGRFVLLSKPRAISPKGEFNATLFNQVDGRAFLKIVQEEFSVARLVKRSTE